jgi:plasmid stabilization system protein ParE
MYHVVKHPLVESDLEDAAAWYYERDPDRAHRFLVEARSAMQMAGGNPLLYSVRFGNCRSVRIAGFPHSVFFTVDGDSILIYRGGSRRPPDRTHPKDPQMTGAPRAALSG